MALTLFFALWCQCKRTIIMSPPRSDSVSREYRLTPRPASRRCPPPSQVLPSNFEPYYGFVPKNIPISYYSVQTCGLLKKPAVPVLPVSILEASLGKRLEMLSATVDLDPPASIQSASSSRELTMSCCVAIDDRVSPLESMHCMTEVDI